jgi:hypothetical protein
LIKVSIGHELCCWEPSNKLAECPNDIRKKCEFIELV